MRILGPALFALACAGFFVFSYNSGYGYDALENLVIGRSLLDGYGHYDFIPSRAFGMYTLVAGALAVTGLEGHVFSSALCTALFAAYTWAAYWVVARRFDRVTALIAAVLVALAAAFMELNFLIAEGPILLSALFGYDAMLRRSARPWLADLWAGFLFGIGFAFKTVAAFYVAGACLTVVVAGLLGRRFVPALARAVRIGLGSLACIALPALYFALVGRLYEHLDWSYVFPALHYPSNTAYLGKLLIKTSFFLVLFAASLGASLASPRLRGLTYRNHAALLALALCAFAALALLKQQASHYMFPAAGFAAIFMAHVARSWLGAGALSRRVIAAGAVLAVLALGSVLAYRPSALERFTRLTSYEPEQALAGHLVALVPAGHSALFLQDSLYLYWITHRYPRSPMLKIDVQELYVLAHDPHALDAALSAPDLALVAFDGKTLGVDDGRFEQGAAVSRVRSQVEARFVHLPTPGFPEHYKLWVPRR